jgi:YfiH family protein
VGDDPASVAANRAAVVRGLGLAPPQWLHQVHGTELVAAADDGVERTGDACWTRQPGLVCAVQSADCLPMLLCDRAGTLVAAVHGGWRGLAAGIVQRVLIGLGVAPDSLLAWLGPAICGRCYEVGDEVRAAFRGGEGDRLADQFRPAERPGHWLADLAALTRRALAGAGVRQVHGGGSCTAADAVRFYSYRRDGVTGRMASLIWRER